MSSIESKRHSLAHLLAAAVIELWPNTKRTIGPAIDNGFYYDFEFAEPISDKDLEKIEKKMRELSKSWDTFNRSEYGPEEAKTKLPDNQYKHELIDEFTKEGQKVTFYTSGNFFDLCRGGHVEHMSEIKPSSWQLDRVAGAYWRGDEKNTMLTRIYGLAFETPEELKAYKTQREEAKKRDHKKLGRELDLFVIDEEVGKGLPMWTPKGTIIKFELEKFTKELEKKYGYDHVVTPYLGSEKLYQTSGHLSHFRQNMYAPLDMDGDVFYLRPMACPHHIKLLMRKPISYKDLPIRYAEIADYNRYEKSGELMGMIRVRKFQLTDAHLFVTPKQLKEEFKKVCSLIQDGMKGLGLDQTISYRFSKRNPQDKENYYADDELWVKAEGTMKEALDEIKLVYTEAEGEAAFYGPKLDVQAKNVNGKEDTLFTAQIDFLLPEKFNIEYTAEDGTKKRPVMIHRSAIGALERTFAFLIERYAGAFPTWLSPVQVKIIPVNATHAEFSNSLAILLKNKNVRVEVDDENTTVGSKIRKTEKDKIPYSLVIGEQEVSSETLTIRVRGQKDLLSLSVTEFINKVSDEINKRLI